MSGRQPLYIFNNDIAFVIEGSPVFQGSVVIGSSDTTSRKRSADEETTTIPPKKLKPDVRDRVHIESDGIDSDETPLTTQISTRRPARREAASKDPTESHTRGHVADPWLETVSAEHSVTVDEDAEGGQLGASDPGASDPGASPGASEPDTRCYEKTADKHGVAICEDAKGERALLPVDKCTNSARYKPESEDVSERIVSHRIQTFELMFMDLLEGNDIPEAIKNCIVNKASESFRSIGLGPLNTGIVHVFSATISDTIEPIVSTMTAAARSLIATALNAAINYVARVLRL